jgi:membrane-associated phospholipid phosphatase
MIILALLVSGAGGANAQSPTSTPAPSSRPTASATPSLEKKFFKNILRDQKAIWTAPAHVDGQDALWLVPLGWATSALIATDRETGDAMAHHSGQLETSRTISYAGAAYTLGAVAGAFYLAGRANNNRRARETGILSAEALADALIVGNAIKGISQRARPRSGPDRSRFFVGGTSFPSGHSIQVWSVATVIAHEYHDHLALQIAAYGIAGAVSVARFTGRYHYLSDVLVGSALGYGIGCYVYRAHHVKASHSGGADEEESRHRSLWPAIAPQYNRRAHDYGVALAWSF